MVLPGHLELGVSMDHVSSGEIALFLPDSGDVATASEITTWS